MKANRIGSSRARIVARWFGVTCEGTRDAAGGVIPPALTIPPRGGQLILLTGASGAGKSTLLRCIRRKSNRLVHWIDLQQVPLGKAVVVDAMADAIGDAGDGETSTMAALEALSRVGLGEVWSYLRTPAQLSEGQRWRLRLALALARAKPVPGQPLAVLAADEFAAPLDRVTALVVSRALRKAVSARADLCAIVATARDDLDVALDPDLIVRCDFGTFDLHAKGENRHELQIQK